MYHSKKDSRDPEMGRGGWGVIWKPLPRFYISAPAKPMPLSECAHSDSSKETESPKLPEKGPPHKGQTPVRQRTTPRLI